jgi:DNA invertase Pin-like site-specific DNA recombinase
MPSSALWRRCAVRTRGSSRHLLPDTKKERGGHAYRLGGVRPRKRRDSAGTRQELPRPRIDEDPCQEGVERVYGEVRMKAALYCRVSTEEQASSGFSLRQQLGTLRRYCKDHDIEVGGELQDTSSGANLDRPGLDALRDRISLGGVEVVLCQDRDRISREPAHVYILREELLEYGTILRSLNDWGDDSPEGALHDGILDQLAKFNRAKTAERTRRGRMRKAQEGKIVGTGKAPYGFYYADHYHVDPDRMPFVHEIFMYSQPHGNSVKPS